jgi:GntR family transcriptional regulator
MVSCTVPSLMSPADIRQDTGRCCPLGLSSRVDRGAVSYESGEIGSDGAPLPSQLELRELYCVSRNTVQDAVRWLVTRGLVITRPGQGVFVVRKIDPLVTTLSTESGSESATYISEAAARSRTVRVSDPRIEIQLASDGVVARELRLTDGTNVLSRHQQRFLDDVPWSLQTTFYPMELVDRGATRLLSAEAIEIGAIKYIEEVLCIKQVGWLDRFAVRKPDRHEADFFSLPDDGRIPVIEIVRTSYNESGEPIRVTITTYPADRNQFLIPVGNVPPQPAGGHSAVQQT